MARKRSTDQVSETPYLDLARRVAWVVAAGLWVMLVLSLFTFSPYDPPSHAAFPLNAEPQNVCGPFGARIAYEVFVMFGPGAWVLVVAGGALLLTRMTGRPVDQLGVRALGVFVMAIATSAVIALLLPGLSSMPEGAGGLLAIAAVEQLTLRFSTVGTGLLLAMCLTVGAIMAADEIVFALPRRITALFHRLVAIEWPRPVALAGALKGVSSFRLWPAKPQKKKLADLFAERGIGVRKKTADDDEGIDEAAGGLGATESFDPDDHRRTPTADDEVYEYAEDEDDDAPAPKGTAKVDPAAIREKIKNLPISFASRKPTKPAAAPVQDLSGYRFPPLELLADPESNFNEQMAKLVREQAEVLEQSLQTYGIGGEVVAIDAGPVITLYDVQLAPGTKVSQITRIASDLARELKAHNIRVVPNTAGKSTVGIEVPNLKKEKVRLTELIALGGKEIFEKMRLPMFLGKDASGNALIADLAAMPHMLIAGTTGSGKSVCINSIVMSFLLCRRPDELKLVLVDPKMVEMAQFRDIPHLMCPVVTEMGKAAAILEWAVTKMDERYELLAEAGVRDIDGYNALSWDELKERFDPPTEEEALKIPKKLPRMVFVIDELADLIMTHKEVESFIVRIAQKARAVGIHLILATQRPQANVVTGLIKSNMPCRVAFKVASGMDSRIVLDQKGGELLLGQGDMLYLSPRSSKLTRAQGTLVDDAEIRAVAKFLKDIAAPSFEPQLVQLKAPGAVAEEDEERDPLFEDAVRVVLEARRGSVSLIQRRLAIGYGRASRLVEAMGEAGIIGAHKGSQAREVNMTLEEWEALKAAAAEEVQAEQEFIDTTEDPEAQLAALVDDQHQTSEEEAELEALAEDEDEDEDAEEDDEEYEYEYDEDDAEEVAEYEEGEEPEDDEEWEYVDEDEEDDTK